MFVGPAQEKSTIGKLVMQFGNSLLAQPSAMGALPTLYASTMPDVASGDYIGPDGFRELKGHPKKVGSRRVARDPAMGARLWEVSEKLTGVKYL